MLKMYTVVKLEQTNIQDKVFLWEQLTAIGRQVSSQNNSPSDVWLVLATPQA